MGVPLQTFPVVIVEIHSTETSGYVVAATKVSALNSIDFSLTEPNIFAHRNSFILHMHDVLSVTSDPLRVIIRAEVIITIYPLGLGCPMHERLELYTNVVVTYFILYLRRRDWKRAKKIAISLLEAIINTDANIDIFDEVATKLVELSKL